MIQQTRATSYEVARQVLDANSVRLAETQERIDTLLTIGLWMFGTVTVLLLVLLIALIVFAVTMARLVTREERTSETR